MDLVAKFQTLKLNKHIDTCKSACKRSYGKLSSSERKHVDELMTSVVALYKKALPLVPTLLAFAKGMNVNSVVALIRTATKVLQKDETVALFEHYIAMYGDVAKDPKRLKAYGAYLRCLLSHMSADHRRIVVAAIDLAFALVHLVVRKEVKGYVKDLAGSVHKYVVKPIHRDLKA